MQFDLFTFFAQIVNFLILLWLLRRFLYRPVTRVMAEREERITARLKEAREQRREAEQEAEAYRQQKASLDEKRQQLLADAEEEAEARRQELLEQAEADAEEARGRWQQAIREEKVDFLDKLRMRAGDAIYRATKKALYDLADRDLEAQIVRVFIRRLRALGDDRKNALDDAARETDTVVIASAFELSDEDKAQLRDVLADVLEPEVAVRFERHEALLAGLELKVKGQRMAWNLEHYLEGLEARVRDVFADSATDSDSEDETDSEEAAATRTG